MGPAQPLLGGPQVAPSCNVLRHTVCSVGAAHRQLAHRRRQLVRQRQRRQRRRHPCRLDAAVEAGACRRQVWLRVRAALLGAGLNFTQAA